MQIAQISANPSADRRGSGTRILMMLATLCAVVLTACGADVNSRLDLQPDYSGQRLFVLTMADNDLNALSGGVEAAERALEMHTPEVLIFEGVEAEDEGYSATFTMPFNSLEDYQNKISALLDASNVPAAEQDMTIQADDQALRTSLTFEESFYNDDLMGWAAEALIAEEVVSPSTTVFTSNGTATVMFDGEEVETSTSLPRIDFSVTQDRRFAEIGLDFEILESGDVHIAMSYLVSDEYQQVQNDFLTEQVEQLDQLDGLEGQVQDSGPVEPADASGEVREIAATFTTPAAVTQGIQLLLANDNASFEILEQSAQGSLDTAVRYVGTNWSCEAICDPNNLQQLDGDTEYPEHWELTEQRRQNGELILEFNRGMPLDSLTSSTQLNLSGSMVHRFEYVVDNETQQGHEDAVADRFAPPANTGSFNTTVRDATTLYTVTFEANNAAELTTLLNDYLAAKDIDEQITLNHGSLTGLWASYEVQADLSAVWELATGGVEGAAVFEIVLPAMHSGEAENAIESGRTVVIDDPDGHFLVTASGPTLTTVWVAVIVLLLLAVIVTLLIRTRRAAMRVWSIASPQAEGQPYNVQGPGDTLTETEILASPMAPGPYASETTKLNDGPVSEQARSSQQTDSFPEVPIPSPTDYEQLQQKLDEPKGSSDNDSAPESTPDDDSDPNKNA